MKKKSLLLISVIAFGLVCCTNKEELKRTKKVELEFVFFDIPNSPSNNKYPKEVSKLCEVIEKACKDTNFVFTPMVFTRADLNSKYKIDLLEGKSGNPTIIYIKKQIDNFFKDSLLNEILTKPKNSNYSFEQYFFTIKERKKYFIYSTNEDLQVDSILVLNSIENLRNAISASLCENKFSKIVVLYEPTIFSNPPPPITNCSELQILLLNIATSLNYADRTTAKDDAVDKYFAPEFSVTLSYTDVNSPAAKDFENGKEYLDQLVGDKHIESIQITDCKKNETGKIVHIDVKQVTKKDLDVQTQ